MAEELQDGGPQVTGQRIEMPIPVSGSGIIKAPNQPGVAGGEHPLPNLASMLPEIGYAGSLDAETVKKSPYPLTPGYSQRSLDYVRGAQQGLVSTALNGGWVAGANFGLGIVDGLAYTVDGLAYPVRQMLGMEEDYSNFISKYIESVKPDPADHIFQKEPGQVDITDPAFWAGTASDVAYSAGIMVPAVAVAALSRGVINPLAGASPAAAALGSTMLAATVQRMGESMMEAHEISRRVYQDAISLGYTDEQAKAMQGKAGSTTFNENMKLVVLDAMQLGAVFGNVKNLAGLRGNGLTRFFKNKYVTYPFEIASESMEEGWQQGIQGKAYDQVFRGTLMPEQSILGKTLSSLGDPDTQRAMIAGGLGGAVFPTIVNKLTEVTKSKEYKEFYKKNKLALEKMPSSAEIMEVKDNKFLDLTIRHANMKSLDKVQDYLDKLSKVPAEEIQKEGKDPAEYYAEVARRQQQVAALGKIYNDVFGRTKVDPTIKEHLFKSYALKYMNDQAIQRTKADIDKLYEAEVGTGHIQNDDISSHLNSLINETIDSKLKATNEIEQKALDFVREQFVNTVPPGFKREPLIADIELQDKVDNLVHYMYEKKILDGRIENLNNPTFQKEFTEKLNAIKEEEAKIKDESSKAEAKAEKDVKASKTRAETDVKTEEKTKEKRKLKTAAELKEQQERVVKTLVDNDNDPATLSDEDKEFYSKSQDTIDKKVAKQMEATKGYVPPKKAEEPKKEEPKGKPGAPLAITQKMTRLLKEKGYSDEQISKMTTKEATDILNKKEEPKGKGRKVTPPARKEGNLKSSTPEAQEIERLILEDQKLVDSRPASIGGAMYVIAGEAYTRVSDVIPSTFEGKSNSNALNLKVGNKMDELSRDFFKGTLKSKYKGISAEAYNDVVAEYTKIKEALDKAGYVYLTNNIVVFDPNLKIAGELDMLLIAPDGTLSIYDFKTSQDFSNFEKHSREGYTYQLSAYSNLLYNRYGKQTDQLAIIPTEVVYDQDGTVDYAEVKPLIKLTYEPKINELIPREDIAEQADQAESYLDDQIERSRDAFAKSALAGQISYNDFLDFLRSKSMGAIINRLEESKVIKKDCP